jgi:7-keto-8-aminopelargonate synthetase-like enzyme
VTKHTQAAAAEALEASKEANNQHNHLRELVIKLQRSHKRTHSQCSSAKSQAVPDPVMDQQANSADEGHPPLDTNCQERAQDGETDEPVSSQ